LKVLITSDDNSKVVQYGGKHVHQELLEKALKELGITVDYLYPDVGIKLSEKIGIALKHPFGALRYVMNDTMDYALYRAFEYLKFRRFRSVNLSGYDIVHAQDVISAVNLLEPKNLVITLHGYLARETLDYNRFANSRESHRVYEYLLGIERQALSRAKLIITVDTRLKNYVINELGVSKKNIVVIQNAVDTVRFCPVDDKAKSELRAKLGLPVDRIVVLVPRRLVPKNGVTFAAQAAKNLDDGRFFFVFLGNGPERESVLRIIETTNNSLVLPAVPNSKIHSYYQASDVVLVPSVTSNDVQEATSLSMLEGMACGKVVVCSNIGGMAEVVKDGVNGFLVEEGSVESICEKLLYIERNTEIASKIGQVARTYVEKNHSYLEHGRKIMGLYQELLAGRAEYTGEQPRGDAS